MKKWLILALTLLSFALVSAETNCSFDYSNTEQFLSSFDSINSKLSTCNLMIPESFNFALKNKVIRVSVYTDSKTENFYISTSTDRISSINSGMLTDYSYYVLLSKDTFDSILQSEDKVGAFYENLENGNIVVDPQGFTASITWFFANLFF
jgi:hypothetical protein